VGELTGGVTMEKFNVWAAWKMLGPGLEGTEHVGGGGLQGEVGRGAARREGERGG
jgi:hypothetical protein